MCAIKFQSLPYYFYSTIDIQQCPNAEPITYLLVSHFIERKKNAKDKTFLQFHAWKLTCNDNEILVIQLGWNARGRKKKVS